MTNERVIDDWIRNWGLRLDKTGRFVVSDGRHLTRYQQQTVAANQTAIRDRLIRFYRGVEAANDAYQREKAAERIVPFVPPIRDTKRMRQQPAMERMEAAGAWLAQAKAERGKINIDWCDDWVGLSDAEGNLVQHPWGLLPEIMLLIRSEARRSTPGLRWADDPPRPGGAA